MKLYGFPGSPNTWKVRAFAHHIGVPLELEVVDLTKGAQRQPEFLALNPTGRTPVLVDGDLKLWESCAIMQYLGAKVKTPAWPDDARTRADIMRWQSWYLQHWSRGLQTFMFENVVKAILKIGEPDQNALAQAAQIVHQEAAVLDKHLERHSYLVNDTLTLADFTVVVPLFFAERAKMPLDKYASIKRWFGTQTALPAWQQTAPKG
jgi:glutathione S-transferase